MTTTRLDVMPRRPPPGPSTALGSALDQVGDRWLLLVVDALAERPLRFGELAEATGAATNILTGRLRTLEVEGLVVATPYSERPVRFSYALSAAGRDLADALVALAGWGARRDGRPAHRFHEACGTAIELRPWCPTCDRLVEPDESPGHVEL